MARSGSTDFTRTHRQIVLSALRLIHNGALPSNVNQTTVEDNASEALNMLVKQWQEEGVWIWKNVEISIPLSYGGYSYSLGPSGDHASKTMVRTEVSTAASSTDTEIAVDSITGISDGDHIGIQLDDSTMQWTTVNGAPAATISLDDALTDDVSVGAVVYAYTTGIPRPIDITEARLVIDGGSETVLTVLTRNEYMSISDKDSTGKANSVYYHPTLDTGTLNVWCAAATVADHIKATARMPFDDFDAGSNNADFPVECLRALKWNLADEIMDEFSYGKEDPGMWERRRSRVETKAAQTKMFLMNRYTEFSSYFFEVG